MNADEPREEGGGKIEPRVEHVRDESEVQPRVSLDDLVCSDELPTVDLVCCCKHSIGALTEVDLAQPRKRTALRLNVLHHRRQDLGSAEVLRELGRYARAAGVLELAAEPTQQDLLGDSLRKSSSDSPSFSSR
jgi:hypothetical protein